MNSDNRLRYFSTPKNAAKALLHGNSPKQNSYWFMKELSKYQKHYIHPDTDDYPILLEAMLKKMERTKLRGSYFPILTRQPAI